MAPSCKSLGGLILGIKVLGKGVEATTTQKNVRDRESKSQSELQSRPPILVLK